MQNCPAPRPLRLGDDSRCGCLRPCRVESLGVRRVRLGADRTPRSHARPACAENPPCRNRTSGLLARAPELHLWPPSCRPLPARCAFCKQSAQKRIRTVVAKCTPTRRCMLVFPGKRTELSTKVKCVQTKPPLEFSDSCIHCMQ